MSELSDCQKESLLTAALHLSHRTLVVDSHPLKPLIEVNFTDDPLRCVGDNLWKRGVYWEVRYMTDEDTRISSGWVEDPLNPIVRRERAALEATDAINLLLKGARGRRTAVTMSNTIMLEP